MNICKGYSGRIPHSRSSNTTSAGRYCVADRMQCPPIQLSGRQGSCLIVLIRAWARSDYQRRRGIWRQTGNRVTWFIACIIQLYGHGMNVVGRRHYHVMRDHRSPVSIINAPVIAPDQTSGFCIAIFPSGNAVFLTLNTWCPYHHRWCQSQLHHFIWSSRWPNHKWLWRSTFWAC